MFESRLGGICLVLFLLNFGDLDVFFEGGFGFMKFGGSGVFFVFIGVLVFVFCELFDFEDEELKEKLVLLVVFGGRGVVGIFLIFFLLFFFCLIFGVLKGFFVGFGDLNIFVVVGFGVLKGLVVGFG